MKTALPILYSFRRCPYAMRARLALAVSGQACELREVVLKNKPQGLLQASPKGTVPVLVLATPDALAPHVLEHSLDIMLWTLGRNDPQAWLAPTHGDVANMLQLIGQCDGAFKHALDRCKYPSRYEAVDEQAERSAAVHWLQGLEQRLCEHHFLFGAHAALADMAIAPFVRQFAAINPDAWTALPLPRLQHWLAQWAQGALLASVMQKWPAWVEGTSGILFPPPSTD